MTACRNCGSERLHAVLSLGEQPLANAYLHAGDLDKPEPHYPLDLMVCPDCFLAQLSVSVPPEELFSEYRYFSSVSNSFVRHAGELVARIVADRGLGPGSLAMEIGSNDGYLLRHYVERGVQVLGVDPAANIAHVANERGIPTIADFFGLALADDLRASGRRADVIHANNVIAHVPDIHGVIEGVARVLKQTGIVVIETPYVRDMVERVEFDTIYHEHLYYYSLQSLSHVLGAHGLEVIDVERIPVHGGSIRVIAAPSDSGIGHSEAVEALRKEETDMGLGRSDYYHSLASDVDIARRELRGILEVLKSKGTSVAAYGAAAKGSVLLNAFGIGTEVLDFVADRSPHKQGLFMPGVHVPIVAAEELQLRSPGACLLLAWNFHEEIRSQQTEYVRGGGRFIIPVPRPRFA